MPGLVGNSLLEQGPHRNDLGLLGPRTHPRKDAAPVVDQRHHWRHHPRHQPAPLPVLRREARPARLVLQFIEQVLSSRPARPSSSPAPHARNSEGCAESGSVRGDHRACGATRSPVTPAFSPAVQPCPARRQPALLPCRASASIICPRRLRLPQLEQIRQSALLTACRHHLLVARSDVAAHQPQPVLALVRLEAGPQSWFVHERWRSDCPPSHPQTTPAWPPSIPSNDRSARAVLASSGCCQRGLSPDAHRRSSPSHPDRGRITDRAARHRSCSSAGPSTV